MTFIIQHDLKNHVPYYVKVVDEVTFYEVYDPRNATQFEIKKEAQQWIDVSSSMKKYSRVVDFDESVRDYEDWVNGGTVRRALACINRIMSRKYNNDPLEEVIDWWVYAVNNSDSIDRDDYRTWPDLFEISKHLGSVQSYLSKDNKERYITFEIYTRKNGDFGDFQRELNMVIDKVTYKDEGGFLILPIMSEWGYCDSLLINPATGRVKVEEECDKNEFPSLEDAFNYMKEVLYLGILDT